MPTTTKGAGGRPPKFTESRRPITVTLPERILNKLECLDKDRARAIVKCVEAVTGGAEGAHKPVELVRVSPGKALIVVGPCRILAQISWLRLIEISPARYLLVLPTGMSVENLEVAIIDFIENVHPIDTDDLSLLKQLRELIGHQRRGKHITKAELVFVDVP